MFFPSSWSVVNNLKFNPPAPLPFKILNGAEINWIYFIAACETKEQNRISFDRMRGIINWWKSKHRKGFTSDQSQQQ